jgi:tRNA (guanosine-2'-O-)-methyltransferase
MGYKVVHPGYTRRNKLLCRGFSPNDFLKEMIYMDRIQKQALIAHLEQFATPHKTEKMKHVLDNRTRHVTVVLEEIMRTHNMSAAIRSAECFGVQDVHVVELRERFFPHVKVSKGACYWVTLEHYDAPKVNNTAVCLEKLRAQGYTIVATSPHAKSCTIDQLPLDSKIALVFGTEDTGITDYVKENADISVYIPMHGFTESLNISVSVALCLYEITKRLRASNIDWHLTDEEKEDIKLEWLRSFVHGAEIIERTFLSK